MRKLTIPLIFGILGIMLIGIGIAYPFVTLYIDTTPPEIQEGVPSNGAVYASLTKITVYVYDGESGVKSVFCTIDGTTYALSPSKIQPLALWQGEGGGAGEIWECGVSITAPGTHSYSITATNNAGLSATKSGTFTIYTALTGKWYVAGIEITSSSQTIYATTATVSFKFVKTAGIADQYIKCEVWESSTKLLTLTNTATGTWEGSYTFSPGRHDITLKAYDGTTTITYSLVGLEIPGAPKPPITLTMQHAFILLGIACLGIAFYKGIVKP